MTETIDYDDRTPLTPATLKLCWSPWWREFKKVNPDARLYPPHELLEEVVTQYGHAIWVHTESDEQWGKFYSQVERLAARAICRWQKS